MVSRARLCVPGLIGTNPTAAQGDEFPIVSGDLQFDANADVRGTLSVTTAGYLDWPRSTADRLNPFGSEVFVERGIIYGNNVREWVSQGYYRITDIDRDKVLTNAPITIKAQDRMSGLIEARLTNPISFDAGTPADIMYATLVNEIYPTVPITYDFSASTTTWPGNHIVEEDRFKFLKEVTESLGKIMYFTYDGSFRVQSPPSPISPLWTVSRGERGVLVSMSQRITRQGIYNAVVVSSDAVGGGDVAPITQVVKDLDPASPTYWNGAFGHVPRFFSSSFIRTDQQAIDAGTAMLDRAKGLPYDVNLSFVPNPALEVLDPVLVLYDDRRQPEIHVLDEIKLGLTVKGAMDATSRKIREGTA